MKVEVKRGQSIYDITLEYTGDMSNVFDIVQANGLSLSDDIDGLIIDIPDDIAIVNSVVNSYSARKLMPATATTITEGVTLEGIGYWSIGGTFKVS